jgi:hypothetical protein
MPCPCCSSPTQFTYSSSPTISHVLEFTRHKHEVCLYLFLCSSRWQHKWEKEGTKELNNILYYFHYFYCSENLHSLKFNYLWFTNKEIKFWHICVWNHVRKITFYTKKFPVTKIHEDGTRMDGFVPSFSWWLQITFVPVIPGQARFHGFYRARSQCPSKFTLGLLILGFLQVIKIKYSCKFIWTSLISHTGKRTVINLQRTGRNGTGRVRCAD